MEEGLVKRLEVAVSRLEAISSQRPNLAPKPNNAATNSSSSQPASSGEMPDSVRIYEENMEEPLKNFTTLSAKIGGDVAEIGSKVSIIFDLHRQFLWYAAGQTEPDSTTLQSKLSPIVMQLEKITAFKESKKSAPFFNHLAAVAEGMQAIFWVTVKKTPAPYVKDMMEAAMYYINRVRTANKENPVHSEWTKALCEIFTALQKYIRQVHTTGLVWNSSPGAAPQESTAAASTATTAKLTASGTAAGGPPAPPPPLLQILGIFADTKTSDNKGGSGTDRQALFAELNKGDAITAGLKKVTADMQTHKNPGLRGSVAPALTAKPQTGGAAGTKPAVVDRPPKTELKDHKVWNIEYHKGNNSITVETDKKQAVYIFKCENSVVQIKGKVNSVTMDSCKKTSVVFESLLAQVEVINCQSVKVQTLGTLPTISIQKTDGCQVYLSKDSLGAEIVTSKSSEMNVLAPQGQDEDFVEYPVPEQFKTTLCPKTKKLITVV
uniref:Adenylyl cyclase-associated protein n=1 Tax=Ditylenchus dipsaci TaxID=166011 RepID=A0A915CNS7_9BILA